MTNSEHLANTGNFSFLEKHSSLIRIWHWLTFLVLTSSLITVLFASTFLDPRGNIAMVQSQLKEKGALVTPEQARAVTHEYEDKMWNAHKLLGFALSFLLLSRMAIEFSQSNEEKLRLKIKNALFAYKLKNEQQNNARHYLVVKWAYLFFYLLLAYMATTGLLTAFGNELGISRDVHHFIKTIHGFGQYLVYTFIFFHLAGVLIAETGKSKGIVSGMISGR